MGNAVFFAAESWWKDDIYWFLAFHDIPGQRKYGFGCSAIIYKDFRNVEQEQAEGM